MKDEDARLAICLHGGRNRLQLNSRSVACHGGMQMANDASFDELLRRLRAGDQSAAVQIVDQFARRLTAMARKRLHPHILQKEDPEDVVQSALKSFFRCHELGNFQLDSQHALWALLVRMTLNKCAHRAEYYFAEKRNILNEADHPSSRASSVLEFEALARDPSPDEAAILAEIVERLVIALKPHQQKIVQLSLEGMATPDIATQVNLSPDSVQRVLKGVRERLEGWIATGQETG
jgi:RNA polymerase sigma-70 factor (ECF subfamily)